MNEKTSFFSNLFQSSGTKAKVIGADEAKKMLKNKNTILIDVRESDEFKAGHIPSALSIPLGTINSNNKLLPSKDKTIIVYCYSGSRSKSAAKKLVKLGYNNVYDLGGIMNWPYDVVK